MPPQEHMLHKLLTTGHNLQQHEMNDMLAACMAIGIELKLSHMLWAFLSVCASVCAFACVPVLRCHPLMTASFSHGFLQLPCQLLLCCWPLQDRIGFRTRIRIRAQHITALLTWFNLLSWLYWQQPVPQPLARSPRPNLWVGSSATYTYLCYTQPTTHTLLLYLRINYMYYAEAASAAAAVANAGDTMMMKSSQNVQATQQASTSHENICRTDQPKSHAGMTTRDMPGKIQAASAG